MMCSVGRQEWRIIRIWQAKSFQKVTERESWLIFIIIHEFLKKCLVCNDPLFPSAIKQICPSGGKKTLSLFWTALNHFSTSINITNIVRDWIMVAVPEEELELLPTNQMVVGPVSNMSLSLCANPPPPTYELIKAGWKELYAISSLLDFRENEFCFCTKVTAPWHL